MLNCSERQQKVEYLVMASPGASGFWAVREDEPVPSRKSFLSIAESWFLLIFTGTAAAVNTIWNTTSTFTQKLTEILFGWVGKALITSFLLAITSAVIYDVQHTAFETVNDAWCVSAPPRHTAVDAIGLFAPNIAPFICLSNFWGTLGSMATQSVITIAFECADWDKILDDIRLTIGGLLESIVLFFFTDQSFLGNRFDLKSPALALQELITNLVAPFDCLCFDLGDVFFFIVQVVTNPNIPCVLDFALNAVIGFAQGIYWTIINLLSDNEVVPSLLWIDDVCSGVQCLGAFLDDFLRLFLAIFLDDPPELFLGCLLSRIICLLLDAITMILTNIVQVIWTVLLFGGSWNPFLDTDVRPLIARIDDVGKCLQQLLELLDVCLGQAAGNFVRLIGNFVEYATKIIQDGEQDFKLIKDGLDAFVGQATYGGGSHTANEHGHDRVYNQTSLTCLIRQGLSFIPLPACTLAMGDLVNAIVNLVLVPVVILDVVLENYEILGDIDGNPLATDAGKQAFEDFINDLLTGIVDRLFGVLDYVGHLVGCIDLLQGLGNAILVTVTNLRTIWTEVQELLVLIVELLFQAVVAILTIFLGELFPGRAFEDEILVFFEIIVDLIIQLVKLITTFLEIVIDYTIGFFFPSLFGQSTLYANQDALATMTRCLQKDEIEDCICGLFLSLANALCVPDLFCIGDTMPGCGVFQSVPTSDGVTLRKRFIAGQDQNITWAHEVYDNPFDYFAGEFPHGRCGVVFSETQEYAEEWRNRKGQSKAGIMPDAQLMNFLSCGQSVIRSMQYNEEQNLTVGPHYLLHEDRAANSSREFFRSVGAIFAVGAENTLHYLNSPEYMLGKPMANAPPFKSFKQQLEIYNITDNMAVQYGSAVLDLLTEGWQRASDRFEQTKNNTQTGRFAAVGKSFWKVASASWATSKMLANEFYGTGISDDLLDTAGKLTDLAVTGEWREYIPQEKRKRHHDEGGNPRWFPAGSRTTEANKNATEDLEITKANFVFYKGRKFMSAMKAWGGMIFGPYIEMIARRNQAAIQFENATWLMHGNPDLELHATYDDIEPYRLFSEKGYYSLGRSNVKRGIWANLPDIKNPAKDYPYLGIDEQDTHPGLSYLYGMEGRVDFKYHVPNSCGTIKIACDDIEANGCLFSDYFQTLGLCQNFLDKFGLVMFCNETVQAMAVFADAERCTGDPIRIAIATEQDPIDCVRFRVMPPGLENDFMCIKWDECRSCPVRRVIPGLECAIVDEIFHRLEDAGKRCLVLFIGRIYPPFNFSVIVPDVFNPSLTEPSSTVSLPIPEPPTDIISCRSVCGDGILSDELDLISGKRCEECDDRNRHNNDGCNSRCKKEQCWGPPLFSDIPTGSLSTLFSYPCPSVGIGGYPNFCYTRLTVKIPWNPLTSGFLRISEDGKPAVTSWKLNTIASTPVVYDYEENALCTGEPTQVRKVDQSNCANATSICVLDGIYPTVGRQCAVEVPIRRQDRSRCSVCGDGVKGQGEDCDPINSWVNPQCAYCWRVLQCPSDPTLGASCIGFCRPKRGFIYATERGMVPSRLCLKGATYDVKCPFNSDCLWTTEIPILTNPSNPNARKRDATGQIKMDRIVRALADYNGNTTDNHAVYRPDPEFDADMERVFGVPSWTTLDEEANYETQVYFNNPEEQELAHASRQQRDRRSIVHLANTITPKDPWMVELLYEWASSIWEFFTNSSDVAGDSFDWVVKFFSSTTISKFAPAEERGFLWYLIFPFWCELPISLDCTLGLGLTDGIVLIIYVFFGTLIITSIVYSGLSSLWISIFSMAGLSIFLGVAFGYPFPGCTFLANWIRLPECIGDEVFELAKVFNGTCIGVFDPDFALSPCNSSCNQQLIDCRDIGFIDGFDTFIAGIEVFLPADFAVWIRTSSTAGYYKSALSWISTFSGHDLIGSFNIALENFDLQGAEGTYAQKVCIVTTSLSIFQPLVIILAFYALSQPVYSVIVPLVSWIGAVLWALSNWIDQNFIGDPDPNEDRVIAMETYALNHAKNA